ncbi:hypothetical protein RJ640_004690 [Escallonia rubra]|uniref:Uncharacterized protein n=1 Tax=Escallonia rubra TaxID=112253 RepID=A0AA88RPS7_9ASTE|nr:hypothetical protein RJ640_004690 [Escallonia rubra]
MKITAKTDLPALLSSKALNPSPDSDLLLKPNSRKPPHRKIRNPGFSGAGVKLKREGAPPGKRSRPETPLLRWKFDDGKQKDGSVKEEKLAPEAGRKIGRKVRKGGEVVVSTRKLAAGLWRLQLPEATNKGGDWCSLPKKDQLGFQHSAFGHCGASFLPHHSSKGHGFQAKDLTHSSPSVSGPKHGAAYKLEPSFYCSNSAMEGATKWDPGYWKTSDEVTTIYGQSKLLDQQIGIVSAVSALEVELEQARARIHELETERRSSKKKVEHFLKKLSEERATWRSREHEKIRAIIDDIKTDLSREKKNRQRMELVNSKLVNELADAKLTAKCFMQDFEKERKARELIEEVCDELAKEIGEDKAEVEALKRESFKLREEVDDERKMLQMAEVWREERVQMKLVDAKVTLEEKYSQMSRLVADLDAFLNSKDATQDVEEKRKAEILRQAAASVDIHDIREFTYDPPNPDDIFSVLEDVNFGEPDEKEIEPCGAYSPASHASKIRTVSPEVNNFYRDSSQRRSNAYVSQNGDIDDDESGWETVSHPEDQGSSFSPDGSDPSVNKIRRDSNVSGSGTEWEDNVGEETPITEISEMCSVPTGQLKKVSSISRLWRSCPGNGENYKIITVEGMKGRLSNGRLSNGAIISPDRCSGKGGLSPPDLSGQWSSPESGNPHITRGMKGCIEWPRGTQKNSLKAKLLEARMESQKIQLRQVLKQKI